MPKEQRAKILQSLSQEEKRRVEFLWEFWARPKQLPPEGDWLYWVLLGGRGFGKTRTGAEWIRRRVREGARHITFAGATAADLRDIMIEGKSGILACSPPWDLPLYEPSKRRLTWKNGAKAELLSADEPERFRGRQSDTLWCDELAAWRYPEAWAQLKLGFRSGDEYGVAPKAVISTTPRATDLIKELLSDPMSRVVRGSTFENKANLAAAFVQLITRQYEGTRFGRQELYAELLEDVPGALWKREWIDEGRVTKAPDLTRIVVAIDPAASSGEESDETGIIVVGLSKEKHVYVLEDVSGKYTPAEWAKKAVKAYQDHKADRIVAEVNNGGDMVEHTIRTVDRAVPYRAVHASRGKKTRAEPVSALAEQGRIHHVGSLTRLEDQLCGWDPNAADKSPDRLDAMVWGIYELVPLGPRTIDLSVGGTRSERR